MQAPGALKQTTIGRDEERAGAGESLTSGVTGRRLKAKERTLVKSGKMEPQNTKTGPKEDQG